MELMRQRVPETLSFALRQVKDVCKQGRIENQTIKTLNKFIFCDSMIPTMGNKLSYMDFLTRPKKGIHIRMDGDNVGSMNKKHGYQAGDNIILKLGEVLRESIDSTVGRKNTKCWHISGDEFCVFTTKQEYADMVVKEYIKRLNVASREHGAYHYSVSVGMGHTPEIAEQNLLVNKRKKKTLGAKCLRFFKSLLD